jgi:hypothetical protein
MTVSTNENDLTKINRAIQQLRGTPDRHPHPYRTKTNRLGPIGNSSTPPHTARGGLEPNGSAQGAAR